MSPNSKAIRRIGIAGYMGAGKSTCACFLAGTHVRVIDADHEAKLLMNHDESIRKQVAAVFGASVVEEGSLCFERLGQAAFASARSMQALNAIVHPALVRRLHDLVFAQGAPCVCDAALIPMWGIEAWFERCLWVTATPSLRMERVKTKTGLSPELIAARMSVQEALVRVPGGPQWTHILNDGSFEDLRNLLVRVTGTLYRSPQEGRKTQ
jgi:dephospho-CoA kinase